MELPGAQISLFGIQKFGCLCLPHRFLGQTEATLLSLSFSCQRILFPIKSCLKVRGFPNSFRIRAGEHWCFWNNRLNLCTFLYWIQAQNISSQMIQTVFKDCVIEVATWMKGEQIQLQKANQNKCEIDDMLSIMPLQLRDNSWFLLETIV